MSISIVQRLFAFFDNVWSFILTLVRSLLALFSFRRRSSDPLTLPRVNRTPKDALARAHTHLRPILLTQRPITFSPGGYPRRALSTRSRSATSTLFPGRGENPVASGSGPLPSGPLRTSPKLETHDVELGLSVTIAIAGPIGVTSFAEETPDTSSQTTHTGSMSVIPLTPPDPCFLAPIPSATDCPYTEPWPIGKPRIVGSPLKISINTGPEFHGPIGSPPPGHWSPSQIWTSTPLKNDNIVPDPALSPFDNDIQVILDPSSVLNDVSHALLSRSRNSIHPYDDTSDSSPASDSSLVVNGPSPGTQQHSEPNRERHHARAHAARLKSQVYPRFHFPDAYACAWRRHGAHVPGKSGRTARTHAYSHSYSHVSVPAREWYNTEAYAHSAASALSPLVDSATEDEDEVPLGRLRERIASRSSVAPIGLGVPISDSRKAAMSPRTRRMSDGCLLALYESTPTRVGVGARCSREVLALATDGDQGPKDWLEALSLRFERKETLGPTPEVGGEVREVCVV